MSHEAADKAGGKAEEKAGKNRSPSFDRTHFNFRSGFALNFNGRNLDPGHGTGRALPSGHDITGYHRERLPAIVDDQPEPEDGSRPIASQNPLSIAVRARIVRG